MTATALTLPSGIKLRADDGITLTSAYWRHITAALSENLCPWCSRPLGGTAECASGHRPVRWHMCPDRQSAGEHYLDTPGRIDPCEHCGAIR